MIARLAGRLGGALVVLFGLSILAFGLVRLVPGDTATALLGPRHTPEDAEALRERLGLDRSLPVQWAIWVGGVARGDLGISTTGQPVAEAIAERLPVTVQLAALALAIALAGGIPLGVAAALRRGEAWDRIASSVGLLGISMPGFWLGTLLILVFALELRWLPPGGWSPSQPVGHLRALVLPALALGASVLGVVLRTTRSAMLAALRADHVRTASAKGLGRLAVVRRHALRPALSPILTVIAIQAGYLLGGAVVIEQVFAIPGLGRLALEALERRDYPLLQAVVLLVGSFFVLLNLAVDLLYGWVDPRVRRAVR